jgi:hypothetical protein
MQICVRMKGIINAHFGDRRPFVFGEVGPEGGGRRAPQQEGCGLAF